VLLKVRLAPGPLVPPHGDDLPVCLSHIAALPIKDEPGLFGLNSNADITLQQQQARQLLDDVLLMQPRAAAATIMTLPAEAATAGTLAGAQAGSRSSSSSSSSSSDSNDNMHKAATAAAAYHGATMAANIAELLAQVPEPLAQTAVPQSQQPVDRGSWAGGCGPSAVVGTFGLESLALVLLQERNRWA